MRVPFVDSLREFLCRKADAAGRTSRRRKAGRCDGRQLADAEALEPRLPLAVGQGTTRSYGVDIVLPNNWTAETIFAGGARANAVNFSGDRDWYRITLQAGTTYRFNLNGTVNGLIPALYDPKLFLRNVSGSAVASNDDVDYSSGNRNSQIDFTPTSGGTFFVDAGAYGSYTGGYTLSATVVASPDDYAANVFTSGTVAVNGSATGVVNSSGDRDWFAVYLVAGRTYRFDLAGLTLSDPLLRFRNGFGDLLAENDDVGGGNRNSQITYRPGTSGFYYLDAGAYSSGGLSGIGSYVLRVTRV